MYTLKNIAVVILNWNGKGLLERFLPSVVSYSNEAAIYVIDNASTDQSIPFLKALYSNIRIIVLQENLGYAGGYNEGLKHIAEPVFCLLNSDVEVTKDWLNPILNAYNNEPKLAMAQPKILNYQDRDFFEYAGAAGGFIDRFAYPYCRGRVFDSIEKDQGQYNSNTEIFWASGACLFIKKNTFENLGGFDQRFFAHMEEVDLCWRAFNRNLKVWYIANSAVFHLGGSTLHNTNPKKTFLNFRNSLMTIVKNSPKPLMLILTRLLLDGIAGIRFLFKGQIAHFMAIIRAHISFYFNVNYCLKQRYHNKIKRPDYYQTTSIVWNYFILKKDR